MEEAKTVNHFNTDSPKQLVWLLYTAMQLPVQRWTTKERTAPSADAKAISLMGEVGRRLIAYRNQRDVRKFVTALGNVQHEGVLYASLKNPGTCTGRLAGGVDD